MNYGELENREIRLETRMIVVLFSSLKSTAVIVYYFRTADIVVEWVNTLIFAAKKTEHNKISTKYSQICVKRFHRGTVKKQEFTGRCSQTFQLLQACPGATHHDDPEHHEKYKPGRAAHLPLP